MVSTQRHPLTALRAFLIDLDGVVYRGQEPVAGAVDFLALLDQTGRPYRLVTNNSRLTAEQFAARLDGMGIHVPSEAILTSGQATAISMTQVAAPGARVLVIGEEGLVRPLLAAGFRLDDERPEWVVVGMDTHVTYRLLCRAAQALDQGAGFIAANPDPRFPVEHGFWPGCGAILAFLQAATGRRPDVVGKPNTPLLRVALEAMGAAPEATAIVGDSLATDITAGHAAGMTTVLVLSGVTTAAQVAALAESPDAPHFIFDDLAALALTLRTDNS